MTEPTLIDDTPPARSGILQRIFLTIGIVALLAAVAGGVYAVRSLLAAPQPTIAEQEATLTSAKAQALSAEIATYAPRISEANDRMKVASGERKIAEDALARAKEAETNAASALNGLKFALCQKQGELNKLNGIPAIACPASFLPAGT